MWPLVIFKVKKTITTTTISISLEDTFFGKTIGVSNWPPLPAVLGFNKTYFQVQNNRGEALINKSYPRYRIQAARFIQICNIFRHGNSSLANSGCNKNHDFFGFPHLIDTVFGVLYWDLITKCYQWEDQKWKINIFGL